jgi:dTDP-4-dehydrorhamnose reductase
VTRIAVTGAAGRLGGALVTAATGGGPGSAPAADAVLAWSRPDFDLDRPEGIAALVRHERPDVVIHAAAWTDVDGCARDPGLALRRNGEATAVLAAACADAEVDLLVVSTNEVFDGRRTDGRGYRPDDAVDPINPYGASKLAGEEGARTAFSTVPADGPRLAIVRTAWLFGPPGADFPAKILAAAERAIAAGEPLRVVSDETGSPTYAPDLAVAILAFVAGRVAPGTFHAVNAGIASRSDWARRVLALSATDVAVEDVPSSSWERPSMPPRWAVLEHSAAFGPPLRPWPEALAVHMGGTAVGAA